MLRSGQGRSRQVRSGQVRSDTVKRMYCQTERLASASTIDVLMLDDRCLDAPMLVGFICTVHAEVVATVRRFRTCGLVVFVRACVATVRRFQACGRVVFVRACVRVWGGGCVRADVW